MPHDSRWCDDFGQESALIREALSNVVIEIHHIGSTAIPGIVAKPVIDILAVVTDMTVLNVKPWLEPLGYQAMGEFGMPGRVGMVIRTAKKPMTIYRTTPGMISNSRSRTSLSVTSKVKTTGAYGTSMVSAV